MTPRDITTDQMTEMVKEYHEIRCGFGSEYGGDSGPGPMDDQHRLSHEVVIGIVLDVLQEVIWESEGLT